MTDSVEPCGYLFLKSINLPGGNTTISYNSTGWSTGRRSTVAWTNINLRDILGKFYDKYELFNLVLHSVTSGLGSNLPGATAEDRVCMIYASGFNWVNQGYDSAKKCRTNYALVGNLFYQVGSGTNTYGQIESSPCTFSKSDATQDIVITLLRNTDGASPTVGDRDFNFNFNFRIYGVLDSELSHDNGFDKQSNSFLTV